MKYIIKGIDCHTCVADLQAHKNQVGGILKIKKLNNSDIILETENNISGKEILNNILEHLEHIGHNHEDVKIYESRTIFLEGLTCANCTAKIEEATEKIEGVKEASFDFATEKYTLVYDEDYKFENIYKNIEKIVDKTEPEVKVSLTKGVEDSHESEFSKLSIIKFIAVFSVLIFLHFKEINKNIALGLYIISYIAVGKDVIFTAIKNIKSKDFLDENFLMTLASAGAFIIGEYPEAVAVMLLYNIGEMFEDIALEKSRKSISATLALKPKYANVIRSGEVIQLEPEEVETGEIIVVKPGEKVPLDGVIEDGESFVNTSNITGESVPRRLSAGDEILSGYVNNSGILKVKVTSEYDNGTIAKILDLVENASGRKAPVEKFITKFAKVYTPIVVGLAAFMVIVLPILNILTFQEALFRACTFLVISCPCALVISVPLGVFSGIGLASKNGIFIKGGNYLEGLSFVSDIVFDKTGTITKGVFEVTDICPIDGLDENEVLKYAAMGEYNSNHPIGRAILNRYNEKVNIKDVKNFKEISGHGIVYEIQDHKILVGNSKLLNKYNVKFISKENISSTKVLVAKDDRFIGEIFVSDVLKDNIKDDIKRLKDKKINLTMLSGDDTKTAVDLGRKAGIDTVYGNLLPEDKVEKLENIIKNSKDKVVFVGDGVNDAPVIARADIGIAMGALGSDSAIEAADIVLMTDEIGKIADAVNISEYTKKVVWQNIVFALGVKIFVLVLGAIGHASMWAAVFADVGVTLIAILNSVKILKHKVK